MTSQALTSLSQRITTTSSLLLERSRVIQLNLPPSASSQNQIIRNLSTIKSELERLEDEIGIEDSGLVVGSGSGAGSAGRGGKGKKGRGGDGEVLRGLQEQFDRLLDVFGEDEVGREKSKTLRRVQRPPTPPTISIPTSPVPQIKLEPPTPNEGPFRDYPDDDEEGDEARAGVSPHELLTEQQMLMDDQDQRLSLLSHSIGRQNHLSLQIGTELDHHHELLEETDQAMDRTSERLRKARGRLDKVAKDAKTYGSTITIVILIFILLILIIVFKT